MQSKLVAQKDISKFLLDTYNTSDAIVCIWASEETPTFWEIEDENGRHINCTNVDDLYIYSSKEITSLFFPDGITKNDDWVKVMVCVSDSNYPLLGWIRIPQNDIRIEELNDAMAGWPNQVKFYI